MKPPYFESKDDCPHPPGEDKSWQESALFVWHDLELGVGGFWRLGQEPVVEALNSCFGVFTAEGARFRSNVTGEAMRKPDRGDTHMGWGDALRVDLDTLAIDACFPDLEAKLRFQDFHPRYDYMALVSGGSAPEGMGHHFEVAGEMTGDIRIGDQTFRINALGYRDRSWGSRSWNTLRSTRWWPCVFGPDLSIHQLSAVTETGQHIRFGYVLRDGEAYAVTDHNILATTEDDGVSPMSGYSHLKLDNGEIMELSCDRSDAILMHVRGYSAIECIGRARLGDRFGMSNLEVSTNPAGGDMLPAVTLGANAKDGLSQRAKK